MQIHKPKRKSVIIIALFVLSIFLTSLVTQVFSQSGSVHTLTLAPGMYPNAVTWTVWGESGTYYAKDAYGLQPSWSGSTNASYVINLAIAYLPSNGGTVKLDGTIILDSSIVIDHNSVTLTGENIGGDAFFTNDGTYHGFSNKWQTTLIADGINAIVIGNLDPYIHDLVFGVTIQNLAINGKNSDATMADNVYSGGSGIRAYTVDTFQVHNVEVQRKQYGINMGPTGGFATYNVIDAVTIENCYFCFNVYGIYSNDWVANVRIDNIFGYINQFSLIYANYRYNWIISRVWSNADGWNAVTAFQSPIYLSGAQDITLNDITIEGAYGYALCPVPLLTLSLGSQGTPEWFRAHVVINEIWLFSTASDAIRTIGLGMVDINDIHAGTTGTISFSGGNGTIAGSIINNQYGGENITFCINGGYVKSSQAIYAYFYDIYNGSVSNIRGFNNHGLIDDFWCWNTANNTVGMLVGDAANPVASTDYQVVVTPLIVTCSGGTGVSITLKDADGNTILSGAASLTATYIPVGYKINFGGFSVAPTTLLVSAI